MSKIKVAINGFGRIGRLAFRKMLDSAELEIVAVNDLTDVNTLAHLLKYDSAQGKFGRGVSVVDGNLEIENYGTVKVLAQRDPAQLPWGEHGVDVVLESTGVFRDEAGAGKHLEAGAKRVVISAPAKGDIKTVVLGVNDDTMTGEEKIVSNASCTTNCLAPMAKVLNDAFGIDTGYITTIHAYTADQRIQDAPHRDLRRARAAAQSIIPTTTGAAAAVGLVLPELNGKLDGCAMRVPVITGSLTDFTVVLKQEVTAEQVNDALKAASETSLNGILEYTTEPLVSVDIIGNPHSCIFDSSMTSASGKLVKVIGWYDNEMGYATRASELIAKIAKLANAELAD
ncbi:MAG: type I glyceraldehyde-3-phosphate dehydrogenase [Bacteroidota bacterium]